MRIVVVADARGERDVLAFKLTAAGHNVVAAVATRKQADRALLTHSPQIVVVVTPLRDGRGADLAEPAGGAPIIAIADRDAPIGTEEADEYAYVLRQPFTTDELERVVRSMRLFVSAEEG